MDQILITIYWFLVALFIALFEIELEGKYGWAEKSATWSRRINFPKVMGLFSASRVLTGYHIFLNIFLFLFMHSTFAFAGGFTLVAELKLLSTYLIWNMFWDFLWFIMNPYYGWKKFSPRAVWWFGEEPWVFNKLPLKYFIQIGIALLFAYIAYMLSSDRTYLLDQLIMLTGFILLTILSHLLLRPIYHRYYWKLNSKEV